MDDSNIEVNLSERRKYRRIDFHEPIQYQTSDAQETQGLLSADLSEGGLRANSFEFIPVNTELDVNVDLGNNNMVGLKGRVVWVKQLPYSDRCQIGLEFIDSLSDKASKEEIRQFIRSRQF